MSASLVLPALASAPEPAAAAAAESTPVTITPNPAYQNPEFEGWGTSLVWFANATGGYPTAVRQDLFDKVFGEDGLRLNIARYNIGGGNATDVPPYLRAGAAVDGWWNPDVDLSDDQGAITTTYADRERFADAWDPDDPSSYDFGADATQRWWLTALKDRITKWEAFSNSPPYFMTESGFVSGGFSSTQEQLKPERIDDFVAYLTTVVDHLEQETGVDFDTLDPFNEPNTNYWGTQLGANGYPTGGRQEGAHFGPAAQDAVVKALADRLASPETQTDVAISAMDETNPSLFATDWAGYSETARSQVDRLNVHTYSQGGSQVARDIAKTADKPLWMSEVEGNWDTSGAGHNLTNIDNGIGLANHITSDLRDLEPSAWVLWQPVEDKYNMEKVENLNWGSVMIDFDCNADGNSERRIADGDADPSCGVTTNAKYNTLRNFTHYIEPGDHLIPSGNNETTTALKASGTGVNLVHANSSNVAREITVDLSKFGEIAPGASVTAFVTTESPASDVTANALLPQPAQPIDAAAKSVVVTVPAKSVTTLVVTGVSGIAADASPLQDGGQYQIVGAQSGLAIAAASGVGVSPAGTLATRASGSATGAAQAWTAEKLTTGSTNRERFALRSSTGSLLAADALGTKLVDASREQAASDPSVQWILSTTDGSRWSLVNAATTQALEVPGQARTVGSPIGVYQSNGGVNQIWDFVSTALTGIEPVTASTVAGVRPTLPTSVVPLYGAARGEPVPVAWAIDGVDWNVAGTTSVPGSGIDGWGTPFTTTATVDVGGFTATDPVSLTIAAGTSLSAVIDAAPTTVPAQIGASTSRFPADVSWDFSPFDDAALGAPAVVQVSGVARSNDPAQPPLAAILSVIVTESTERNIAPDPTTTATATSTESGYSIDRTRNGVRGDKGWSNWVPGQKNPSDTLTYDLGSPRVVDRVSVVAFKDGSSLSWPTSLTVQYLDDDGVWTDAPDSPTVVPTPTDGSAPVVDVSLGQVTTSQVRVVMTARADTHMVISEVEIYAQEPSPADVATLGALRVNGIPVDGFSPSVLEYAVPVGGTGTPVVDALPTDQNATVTIEFTPPVVAARAAPADAVAEGGAVITVTAADGESRTVTTLAFDRFAVVSAVIPATATVGETIIVTSAVDPTDSVLSYEWLLDGVTIDGATSESYEPTSAQVGRTVSVTVTASAPGFDDRSATSEGAVVAAAPVPVDPGDGSEPGGGSPSQPGSGAGTGTTGTAGSGQPSGGTDSRGGSLANTGGGETNSVAIVAALGLFLLGAALVGVRRRSRKA